MATNTETSGKKSKGLLILLRIMQIFIVLCLIDGFLDIVYPTLSAAKSYVLRHKTIHQRPVHVITGSLQDTITPWPTLKTRIVPSIRYIYTEHHSPGVNIAADGMRSNGVAEPEHPTSTGYLLGSSVAFGYGVADNQTLAAHLEQRLKNVRIENYAIAGTSISENMLRLHDLLTHGGKPDFVIIAEGALTLYTDCMARPDVNKPLNIFQYMYKKFNGGINNYKDFLCTSKENSKLAAYHSARSTYNAILELREKNIPFFVFYLPTPYDKNSNVGNLKKDKFFRMHLKEMQYAYSEYHDQLNKFDIPEFIDLSDNLPKDKEYFLDYGGHISGDGYKILSEKIYEVISKKI